MNALMVMIGLVALGAGCEGIIQAFHAWPDAAFSGWLAGGMIAILMGFCCLDARGK